MEEPLKSVQYDTSPWVGLLPLASKISNETYIQEKYVPSNEYIFTRVAETALVAQSWPTFRSPPSFLLQPFALSQISNCTRLVRGTDIHAE